MEVLPFLGARACKTVRAAATHDLGALADVLVDVTREVELSQDERATALLDEATACFERAERAVDGAQSPEDFGPATAEIGRARYLLAAARARLARSSLPEQKQPCFFDPAHGPAERFVAWTPLGGDPRTVPVCDADGDLVEGDIQPEPRVVVVGEEVLPYWDAPAYFISWFSGYFDSVSGCRPEDLLAGMPLGEAFADDPVPEDGETVTREALRERWSLGPSFDDED